jgi:hypothetical protein
MRRDGHLGDPRLFLVDGPRPDHHFPIGHSEIVAREGLAQGEPSERLAQANALIAQESWRDRKVQKPFGVEYETHNGQYVK